MVQLLFYAAFVGTRIVQWLEELNNKDNQMITILWSYVTEYVLDDGSCGYFQNLCTLNCLTFYSFSDVVFERNKNTNCLQRSVDPNRVGILCAILAGFCWFDDKNKMQTEHTNQYRSV